MFTRYGSSIKELYTIDRSKNFTESTLYQLRNDSNRAGSEGMQDNKFYLLDGYIYVPDCVEALSGLVLSLDHFELDESCGCTENCDSVWDHDFVAPDSMLEDIIGYAIQNISMTKNIAPDEKPDLSNNIKQ